MVGINTDVGGTKDVEVVEPLESGLPAGLR